MEIQGSNAMFLVLLLFVSSIAEIQGDSITCYSAKSPCFLQWADCPAQCSSQSARSTNNKVCYLNCKKPTCQAECTSKKPNCNGPGAACLDPRFIGGDGIVFYFHGKSNEHFSLVSDLNLQINARFIGLRPAGRSRDYTWIQALGVLFDSHTFSVEATKATAWDAEVDHLKVSYDGMELEIPEGYPSVWQSTDNSIKVERTSNKNSALITLPEVAEISVNVIPARFREPCKARCCNASSRR